MVLIAYIDLTPGLRNNFATPSHHPIVKILRTYENEWTGFHEKHPDFSLGFTVATKGGVKELEVKGPTIFRKLKSVDYSIFLPDDIQNMNDYLDNVFKGISHVLEKYNVIKTDNFKRDIESLYKTLVV